MDDSIEAKHISHRNRKTAYHVEWGFRREAAIWKNDRPITPNFFPYASQLRNWLVRKRFDLPEAPLGFSNPYTSHAGVLVNVHMLVINECAAFIKDKSSMHPAAAEIRRIKLYGDLVLSTARICEVFIKQLLYCTTFPERDYSRVALGALLTRNCSGCESSGNEKHRLSLAGSLAHRYHLCHTYEKCLDQHLFLVKQRRDLEAAHSGAAKFERRTTSETRALLDKQTSEVGNACVHMLDHISEFEVAMLVELTTRFSEAWRTRPQPD
jgi:hypothetical protein